jgi:lycopene cyclase domain-containing protein
LNQHLTYFVILAVCFAGPLVLSFDKKVAFYKKWRYLFPAMLLPALVYIAWDIYFTYNGVWWFNETYITGIYLANLPIEEVLFFFIVPYCCVFIYECIRSYFPRVNNEKNADRILKWLAVGLAICGAVFFERHYTFWVCMLNAFFIACIYTFRDIFKLFDAASFLLSYVIILIPFLLINGFLTAIPVVLYNHAENLGIRIYTIPAEDIFYGMLLVLLNIIIYDKLKSKYSQ